MRRTLLDIMHAEQVGENRLSDRPADTLRIDETDDGRIVLVLHDSAGRGITVAVRADHLARTISKAGQPSPDELRRWIDKAEAQGYEAGSPMAEDVDRWTAQLDRLTQA